MVVVVVRTVALDVHERFAEVAMHEGGALRRLGRLPGPGPAGRQSGEKAARHGHAQAARPCRVLTR